MDKKKEFQKMLDQILVEIIKSETSGKQGDLPVLTRNVINMLRNLNQQVAEQQAQIEDLEKELREMRNRLNLLLEDKRNSSR